MTSKPKHKYQIIITGFMDYGDGHTESYEQKGPELWAVSEGQAVSHYCYRHGLTKTYITPWSCDGYRHETIGAKLLGGTYYA